MTVTLVLPEVSDDRVSSDMRYLTRILVDNNFVETDGGYGLGGEYGYGVNYENDTFYMHPFCWCDQIGCAWCGECQCSDDAEKYFLEDGTETDWDTFFDAGGYINGTSETIRDKQCLYCKQVLLRLPHFYHKSTGTKVYWYKYIGRSMNTEINGDWNTIFQDVVQSLQRS